MRYWETSDYQERHWWEPDRRGLNSAVKWLVIASVAAFAAFAAAGLFSLRWEMLRLLGLSRDTAFRRWFIWQLLTYAFLHADVWHLLFNMLCVYMFGREIEQIWGPRKFLLFYLTAAVFAGALFAAADHFIRPQQPSVCIGASGAVMAILMVYALWWPHRTVLLMFVIPMRMRTLILITIGIEFLQLLDLSQAHGVANMAHLGGLLYGFIVVRSGPALNRALEGIGQAAERRKDADQQRLDELLDKVHQKGMNGLSWRERRFLKKFSARR